MRLGSGGRNRRIGGRRRGGVPKGLLEGIEIDASRYVEELLILNRCRDLGWGTFGLYLNIRYEYKINFKLLHDKTF
jgi:hypothetical protein